MNDRRSRYYVSVQADTIVKGKEDAAFEFEIDATEDEIDALQALFDGKDAADDQTHFRSLVPWVEYHNDSANDRYDQNLTNIYRLLHKLGTPETKRHIESMNVLGPGTAAPDPSPESMSHHQQM